MSSDSTRAILDSLGSVTEQERARLQALASRGPATPNPLGLRFQPRDRVLDVASGDVGEVLVAKKDADLSGDVYRVLLDTGATVTRGAHELELAPRVGVPGGGR